MKILHIIAGLNEKGGGTSEVVPRMCEELVRAGHEVTLMTVAYGNLSLATKRAVANGVKLIVCDCSNFLPTSLSYSPEFSRHIRYHVAMSDLVHLHCLWQWPCWRAASEAIRQDKPYVIQTHGFLEPERLKKSRIKKLLVGYIFERPRLGKAKRIIATAESEKLGILEYGTRTSVDIVPIGIDTTNIDSAKKSERLLVELGVPKGKKVLLYLSRLAPIKGLDMLAHAWLRLTEFHEKWHLLIVGDDLQGYSDIVKREYNRLVTDGSVSIPGPIYGDAKFSLLKSVDAFVLPTRSENFSIAVQEALAAGVPVVCTKGAPWEVINQDGAGRWVDISSDGIYSGLRDVMICSDVEWRNMSSAGRRIVARDFKWDVICKKLVSLYESVLYDNLNK